MQNKFATILCIVIEDEEEGGFADLVATRVACKYNGVATKICSRGGAQENGQDDVIGYIVLGAPTDFPLPSINLRLAGCGGTSRPSFVDTRLAQLDVTCDALRRKRRL